QESSADLQRDQALLAVARRNVALAHANVRNAEASLKLARIIEGYTTLRAPFNGVIMVRQAELGEVVGPVPRSSRSAIWIISGCALM
ncbi:hypothetical protein B1A_09742, partial [mine drainage metagenome]